MVKASRKTAYFILASVCSLLIGEGAFAEINSSPKKFIDQGSSHSAMMDMNPDGTLSGEFISKEGVKVVWYTMGPVPSSGMVRYEQNCGETTCPESIHLTGWVQAASIGGKVKLKIISDDKKYRTVRVYRPAE